MSQSSSDAVSPAMNTIDTGCPKCGALAGDSCRDPKGRKRWHHVDRAKAAYRAADVYNPHYNPDGSRVPEVYRLDLLSREGGSE